MLRLAICNAMTARLSVWRIFAGLNSCMDCHLEVIERFKNIDFLEIILCPYEQEAEGTDSIDIIVLCK